MLAKLVRVEDETVVTWDKFADENAVAAENERAQAESRGALEWRPVTKDEWFELGKQTALFVCADFGGSDNE